MVNHRTAVFNDSWHLLDAVHYHFDSQTEIENVSENIDVLNSALDSIEERADRIRAQLLELLSSNREIRQSIREENEKLQPTNNDGNDDSASPSNAEREQREN